MKETPSAQLPLFAKQALKIPSQHCGKGRELTLFYYFFLLIHSIIFSEDKGCLEELLLKWCAEMTHYPASCKFCRDCFYIVSLADDKSALLRTVWAGILGISVQYLEVLTEKTLHRQLQCPGWPVAKVTVVYSLWLCKVPHLSCRTFPICKMQIITASITWHSCEC